MWLDELQDYLREGLPVSVLASLLRSAEPVIVIGTLWPDLYQEFTAAPEPGKEDRYRNERRLLKLAHVFDVASHLSTGEHRRALAAAESDPRIAVALDSSDYPMTAVLAAAPELARRWENAPDRYCETVITAAIDYKRLGVQAPVPPAVLRAAMSGYLSPAEQAAAREGWFEASLAYATRPLRGAASALTPVGCGMGDVTGYAAADYLLEYGTRTRRTAVPPESFWTAHLMAGVAPGDQVRIGEEAAHRALLTYAEPLYQSAANAGDAMGWVRLAELQEWRCRQGEAEALWRRAISAGYQAGWGHLAARLSRQKRTDDQISLCREALAAGYTELRWSLAGLLSERRECPDEAERLLEEEVASGNLDARISLAELLVGLGRTADAERLWRKAIADGVENSRSGLAGFLREQGRIDEAIAVASRGHRSRRRPVRMEMAGRHVRAAGAHRGSGRCQAGSHSDGRGHQLVEQLLPPARKQRPRRRRHLLREVRIPGRRPGGSGVPRRTCSTGPAGPTRLSPYCGRLSRRETRGRANIFPRCCESRERLRKRSRSCVRQPLRGIRMPSTTWLSSCSRKGEPQRPSRSGGSR